MASDLSDSKRSPLPRAPSEGGSLTLSLVCPKCGATGQVYCDKLEHGLRCPKCQCNFVIARGGKIVAVEALPHHEYRCPRCNKNGSIPSLLTNGGARCDGCNLLLKKGPDGRLHSEEKAETLWRAHAEKVRKQKLQEKIRQASQADPKILSPKLIKFVSFGLLSILVLGIAIKLIFFSNAADSRAIRFTRTCLAGRWNDAEAYFEDDAVQRVEFERWRGRHFTSILDTYRPRGDSVSIEIETVSESETEKRLRIVMTSAHIGTRKHEQVWTLLGGEWKFNALATLAEEDKEQLKRMGKGKKTRAVGRYSR